MQQQDDEKSLYTTMRPARNGRSLVTFSTYEERQDVLRNTNIMEDDVNHRSSRIYRNENGPPPNGAHYQAPPPPPEFASTTQRTQQQQQPQYANNTTHKFPQQNQQQKPIDYYSNNNGLALKPPTEKPPEPPATPIPDYDNVEINALPTKISSSARPTYGYASTNIVTTNAYDNKNNSNNNNNNNNRRTSRPGTITIGEYEQPQQRREPAKFDFVSSPKRSNGSADVSPDDLQAELQNTLTRSKLKKSAETFEHQSNCPLRNGYENYENVVRKIHSVSINEIPTVAPVRMSNGSTGNGGTNGILKNGNRHSGSGGSTKNSDKTITFGN